MVDGDTSARFSYRLVAKRKGYEGHRLERAPWADDDVTYIPVEYPDLPDPGEPTFGFDMHLPLVGRD